MSLKEEVESRVYLVAGEASGDRLAADLLRELKKNPKLRAFGVGRADVESGRAGAEF